MVYLSNYPIWSWYAMLLNTVIRLCRQRLLIHPLQSFLN